MARRIIVVGGAPSSANASIRTRNAWKSKVRVKARAAWKSPWKYRDLRIEIQFFRCKSRMWDAENISRLVCDALEGIAYADDRQIVQRQVEIRSIRGPFEIVGANKKIVDAVARGKDFVAITVNRIGGDALPPPR
jgi:hypothetical protein